MRKIEELKNIENKKYSVKQALAYYIVSFNEVKDKEFESLMKKLIETLIDIPDANKVLEQINTELIGLSVDSNSSHLAWVYDIYCRTGIRISFPIISDRNGKIARKYGMISSDISNTETVRNVFIIDDKGTVRTILIYPMNVGRFIPEIIRIIQALQMSDCTKGSTAANWIPNQPVIVPMPKTFEEVEERVQSINQNRNGISWYLSFKEANKECIK